MNIDLLKINEHMSTGYAARTAFNGKKADLTIAFAVDHTTSGEILTKKVARNYLSINVVNMAPTDIVETIVKKCRDLKVTSINVAGNGMFTMNKHKYTQADVNMFIYVILSRVQSNYPIKKIYTGGQTGVDIAGAIAGYLLNIETEVTFPRYFLQKLASGKTITNTYKQIMSQIIDGAAETLNAYNEGQHIRQKHRV